MRIEMMAKNKQSQDEATFVEVRRIYRVRKPFGINSPSGDAAIDSSEFFSAEESGDEQENFFRVLRKVSSPQGDPSDEGTSGT